MTKITPATNLTPEEQAMHDAIDWSSARAVTPTEQARLNQIAKNTQAKNKTITVRLSEKNLIRLKAKAAQEGIPYQTFVSALIQKNT
jgi:predicted DNA binding CopG/RHH family protein